MYQNLPDNTMELVADAKERVEYVLCLNNMKDFLSGERNAKPFCLLTNERVYVYECKGDEVEVKTCTPDDVQEIRSAMSRSPKKLLYMLYAIPLTALFFGLRAAVTYAIFQGIDIATILPIVFWTILEYAALAGAVAIIISGLVKGCRADHAVMQIYTKRGEIMCVAFPSRSTAETENFKKEIRRVKAARKAINEEVFW